jgi:hypothetical protein
MLAEGKVGAGRGRRRRVGTAGRPRHLRDHRTNADAAPGAAAGHPGWAVEPTCRRMKLR